MFSYNSLNLISSVASLSFPEPQQFKAGAASVSTSHIQPILVQCSEFLFSMEYSLYHKLLIFLFLFIILNAS